MKRILITLSFICCGHVLYAQGIEEDENGGTSIPIDGGIVTVTLIAAAYGAKRKSKQNKESNDDI